MRFVVEAWAPGYGQPVDADALEPSRATVDEGVEAAAGEWSPRRPPPGTEPAGDVLLVDGVRRVDARVWLRDDDGMVRPGICASYAAGAVRCNGRARVERVSVGRALFAAGPGEVDEIATRHSRYEPRRAGGDRPEQLSLALQLHMNEAEAAVATACGACELILVDGPLRGRQHITGAVGYVKTHQVAYLSPPGQAVVAALAPGERTPLFLTTTSWSRFSCYLRLPGPVTYPWAGVVRCEFSADLAVSQAAALADRVATTVPRFASAAHKDPRAPQNLYPIAGLERELTRRLGDPLVLHRGLARAAAGVTG